MNESPDVRHLDRSSGATKAVDLNAPCSETDAARGGCGVKVRFYGRLADAIGREAEVDAGEAASIEEIRRILADRHPTAAHALSRSRACLNDALVDDQERVRDDDVPEFLPPVSGG
jgi:molybdopterin converting factor small subunit